MSDASRRGGEDTPPDEIAVIADGIDEYIDKARYQMLFDARKEAASALRSVPDAVAQSANTGDQKYVSGSVWSAVNTYIHEVEPLFKNTRIGQIAWHSAELGPVPLPRWLPGLAEVDFVWSDVDKYEIQGRPVGFKIEGTQPSELSRASGRPTATAKSASKSRTQNRHTPPTVIVEGVSAYTDLSRAQVGVERMVEKTNWRGKAKENEQRWFEATPPVSLSRNAFRVTNMVLSELGIGLEAEAKKEQGAKWTAEYRDED